MARIGFRNDTESRDSLADCVQEASIPSRLINVGSHIMYRTDRYLPSRPV
jgi:hypothetical protein